MRLGITLIPVTAHFRYRNMGGGAGAAVAADAG
jgi:hypothetical protein